MGGGRNLARRLHGKAHGGDGFLIAQAFDDQRFLAFRPGQCLESDHGEGRQRPEGSSHQLRQIIACHVLHDPATCLEGLATS